MSKINNPRQVSKPTRPIHFEWPFASAYIMQPPTSTSSPVNPRTPPVGVNLLKQVYTSMNCAIASGVVVNAAITVAADPVTTTARSAVHFVFMRCGLPVRLVVHSKLSSYVLVHGGRHTVGVKKRRVGSCCAWVGASLSARRRAVRSSANLPPRSLGAEDGPTCLSPYFFNSGGVGVNSLKFMPSAVTVPE